MSTPNPAERRHRLASGKLVSESDIAAIVAEHESGDWLKRPDIKVHRGRPPRTGEQTRPVQIRFSISELGAIDAARATAGVDRSTLVREAVKQYLDKVS